MAHRIKLQVEGMTCTSCAAGVKKFLEKKGAKDVFVSFENNEADFIYEELQPIEPIIEGIEKLGYTVSLPDKEDKPKSNPIKHLELRLIISAVFTVPLLAHMFVEWGVLDNGVVQLILTLVPAYFGFSYFGKSALASLKNGYPNMDVLIFMGFISALVYSLYGLFNFYGTRHLHHYLFFETAASIITFALTGAYIERKSITQTTTAISELIKLQPQKAKIITSNGTTEEIDIKKLKKGDLIALNTGDQVPADAQVIKGEGTLNESAITGENRPVIKTVNDLLIAGTIVESGNYQAVVNKIGKETFLSKVIELVKNAQQKRPRIQRIGDKVSAIFVPSVIVIALITLVINYWLGVALKESLIRAVAVLVISCPCAVGLATPTAIAVAIGMAARKGILIKGAETLEILSSVNAIVFDKTGTLTTGHYKITNISFSGQYEPQLLKNIIISLEQHSSHPIAKSIIKEIDGKIINELVSIKEEKGMGIEALFLGKNVKFGSKRFVKREGNFDLALTIDDELVCMLTITDNIKEGAKEQLAFLKNRGYRLIMLSGDKHKVCSDVALQLGIDEVFAEKLPNEKLEIIERLRNETKIAMVGDGVNDAPALMAAHVGISISGSTEVAMQSAQVILTKGNEFEKLNQLFSLSKNTIKTIKQNYFWALIYNVIAIPLAAYGFLSPIIGALSMAFSDLVVVGNSLLLKKKRLN